MNEHHTEFSATSAAKVDALINNNGMDAEERVRRLHDLRDGLAFHDGPDETGERANLIVSIDAAIGELLQGPHAEIVQQEAERHAIENSEEAEASAAQ